MPAPNMIGGLLIVDGSDWNPVPPEPPSPTPWQQDRLPQMPDPGGMPELSTVAAVLAPVVAIYGKAFLESLAAHTADSVTQLPQKIRRRWFGRTGAAPSDLAAILDIEGSPGAAAILVTANLPDEARLALLDLDPTESSLRGKILAWDTTLNQWIPRTHPDLHGQPG